MLGVARAHKLSLILTVIPDAHYWLGFLQSYGPFHMRVSEVTILYSQFICTDCDGSLVDREELELACVFQACPAIRCC
jgi:hypothetical protein